MRFNVARQGSSRKRKGLFVVVEVAAQYGGSLGVSEHNAHAELVHLKAQPGFAQRDVLHNVDDERDD